MSLKFALYSIIIEMIVYYLKNFLSNKFPFL